MFVGHTLENFCLSVAFNIAVAIMNAGVSLEKCATKMHFPRYMT
jgi:hypothetical protein